ncbi:unnamed protein product [Oppiella nova]|uniref:Uncharacterized protein n=1 Tax=Oppiella nova TaxID=334625 RepID=A0A7R9QNP2_9ACAR|nr:unnamed protein product [Oppiella nova]CAG2169785.1 unnamed protein product [Oppiella nova]
MDILDNDIEVDNNNEAMEAINGDKRHRRSQRSAEYKSWDLYVYTIAMFVNHFAVGVNSGIGGPALVDLRYMLNTTINLISISLVINNIGYLSGSLFGLLYKYINRQLTIVVIMAAMAASITLIPDCPNLWILYLFQYAIGLGAGIWDTANNVWLIEMWPQNSSPVLQFSQFMYGLGSVFGPIIVKPYLTGETNHTLAIQLSDFGDITSTPSAPVDRRALLRTPYLISGILQGFIPVVFLIMYFVKQYKSRDQRLKRKDSSESLLSDHLDDRDDGAVRSSQIEDNCLESTYSPITSKK